MDGVGSTSLRITEKEQQSSHDLLDSEWELSGMKEGN
jgi:hypothetical protein